MAKVKTYWYIEMFVWDTRRGEYLPQYTKDIQNKQTAQKMFRSMSVSKDVPQIGLYQVEDDGHDSTHTRIEMKDTYKEVE